MAVNVIRASDSRLVTDSCQQRRDCSARSSTCYDSLAVSALSFITSPSPMRETHDHKSNNNWYPGFDFNGKKCTTFLQLV